MPSPLQCSAAHTTINMIKNCLKNMPLKKKKNTPVMWLECNCLMFLSPCICLSLFCTCWEDAYNGAVFFSFLVRSRSCFCPLVVGILKKKKKKMLICCILLYEIFSRFSLPSLSLFLSLPPSLSLSLFVDKNVCMLMVCDVGKVVDIIVSCPLCVSKLHLLASLHAILDRYFSL